MLSPCPWLLFLLKLLPPGLGSPTCWDDLYSSCPARALRGECEGEHIARGHTSGHVTARIMLGQCRESCYNRWSAVSPASLPEMISKHGGLSDTVTDPFGFRYQLCGPGGFTSHGRATLLALLAADREQPAWVPRFTLTGFMKTTIPTSLWRRLAKDYERVMPRMVPEPCILSVINCQEIQEEGDQHYLTPVQRTFMMELGVEVLEATRDELLGPAEAWSGVLLEHTATYGVRRYTNNSWLVAHSDRLGTHVISAIMNLGQEVEEDWPLYIKDHEGESHQVVLAPGQMVWYESARLVHGRMEHLRGSYFDNLFIHFRPRGDWYRDIPIYEVGERPWKGDPVTLEQIKASQPTDPL